MCRELIPAGSVFAFLAEHRGTSFPVAMFADVYPSRNGRPEDGLSQVRYRHLKDRWPDLTSIIHVRAPA
jgi:hypothetical protein